MKPEQINKALWNAITTSNTPRSGITPDYLRKMWTDAIAIPFPANEQLKSNLKHPTFYHCVVIAQHLSAIPSTGINSGIMTREDINTINTLAIAVRKRILDSLKSPAMDKKVLNNLNNFRLDI